MVHPGSTPTALRTNTVSLRFNAAVPPSRYFPRFNPVHPGPDRVCRFVPVLSPVPKNIFAVPSSRFITVCPGRHTSTPGLINQDHPGGHPFHPGGHPFHPGGHPVHPGSSWSTYGGHPVHPGQHTVHPGQHMVHYCSLRFITMPYGSLRFIPVNTRFIMVNYGSLRYPTVHYGNSDHPGQHQVHYGSLRFIPVNTRFFQVNTRFEFSPRFDAGSTELSNMSYLLKFVPGLPKVIQGSSRLDTGHSGSSRSTPGSSRFLPVGEPGVEPG